ncbi:MAG: hypothetical protein TREMPRED_005094, partial [Tremellales sp. Tagirdzhanova-0007]
AARTYWRYLVTPTSHIMSSDHASEIAAISFTHGSPRRLHRHTPNFTQTSTSTSPSITRMSASHSTSSLSQLASRSPSRKPPRLPATNRLSYFPPFESMGSSTEELSPAPSRCDSVPRHGKGRSLSSLAGIISWIAPTTALNVPQSATSDKETLQALARLCGVDRQRALKPTSPTIKLMGKKEVDRPELSRTRSEEELERTIGSVAARQRETEEDEGEFRAFEKQIIETPCCRHSPTAIAVASIVSPAWRLPHPSPPVTCLSLQIPIEAFHNEIENPINSTSPSKEEVGYEIEGTLSATKLW